MSINHPPIKKPGRGLLMYGEFEAEQRRRLLAIVAFVLILAGLGLLASMRCGL